MMNENIGFHPFVRPPPPAGQPNNALFSLGGLHCGATRWRDWHCLLLPGRCQGLCSILFCRTVTICSLSPMPRPILLRSRLTLPGIRRPGRPFCRGIQWRLKQTCSGTEVALNSGLPELKSWKSATFEFARSWRAFSHRSPAGRFVSAQAGTQAPYPGWSKGQFKVEFAKCVRHIFDP